MKTSTKLRLAGKGAGGALGATYRTGKLVGGAQHELTGGRRPVYAWGPAVGGLITGFAIAYLLDRENGRERRSALLSKLFGGDDASPSHNGSPSARTQPDVEVFVQSNTPAGDATDEATPGSSTD